MTGNGRSTSDSGFSALISSLYASGTHNIVIRDFDHSSGAATSAIATDSVMKVMKAHDARMYYESPAEANPILRDHARGQISDDQIRDMVTPIYGPGSDIPAESMIINAANNGVHLRFHDHGYKDMLGSFPPHLQESGLAYAQLAMSGCDPAKADEFLATLPKEDAKAIRTTLSDAFDRRIEGQGDIKNAAFINVNAEGNRTLTLIGALHEKTDDQLSVTGKTTGVTVYRSDVPQPSFMRDADGKVPDSPMFGEYAHDIATGETVHIPEGSPARAEFLAKLSELPVANASCAVALDNSSKAPPAEGVSPPAEASPATGTTPATGETPATDTPVVEKPKLPTFLLSDQEPATGAAPATDTPAVEKPKLPTFLLPDQERAAGEVKPEAAPPAAGTTPADSTAPDTATPGAALPDKQAAAAPANPMATLLSGLNLPKFSVADAGSNGVLDDVQKQHVGADVNRGAAIAVT